MAKIKSIQSELEALLSLKATEGERQELMEKGINVKNPTKLTLVTAALFFKAQGGDLSAIKEVFSHLRGETAEKGGVVFIDDIRSEN